LASLLEERGDEVNAGGLEAEKQEMRYVLLRRINAGGMGVVFEAYDRTLKRRVALKRIRGASFASPADLARFALETEAVAALDHPHIVPVYEVGETEGMPFFTMKLIGGTSLAARLADRSGRMGVREVARLMSRVARAVHHAHQRGVLHRDLKPGNVLIDERGEPWLTDFGLAKLTGSGAGVTVSAERLGTTEYMSPEAVSGEVLAVSTASDVWSLGVMLWQMVCGVVPFGGQGHGEVMRRILADEPVVPVGMSCDGDLLTVARRCLEKDPARRIGSAAALADDLDRWLAGEPIHARAVSRRERFFKWVRRKPALAALYGVSACGVVLGAVLWFRAEDALDDLRVSHVELEHSLQHSTALRLAGTARLQLSDDPSRALLLAAESVRHRHNGEPVPGTVSALMDILTRTGGLEASAQGGREWSHLLAADGPLQRPSSAISPDGRWLLTAGFALDGGRTAMGALFDLQARDKEGPVRRFPLPAGSLPSNFAWAWEGNSRGVVVVSAGRVERWTMVTEGDRESAEGAAPQGEVIGPLPVSPGREALWPEVRALRGEPVIFWKERHELVPGDGGGKGLARLRTVELNPGGIRERASVAMEADWSEKFPYYLSPDGNWLVVRSTVGERPVQVIDVSGREPVMHRVVSPVWGLQQAVFSTDSRHVAILIQGARVVYGELPALGAAASELRFREMPRDEQPLRALALSPDNQWMAVTGDSGRLGLFSLRDAGVAPFWRPLASGYGQCLAFSGHSRWLAAGGGSREIHVWRVDDFGRGDRGMMLMRGLPEVPRALSFSSSAAQLVAEGASGVARRWPLIPNGGAFSPKLRPTLASKILSMAVTPDGEWLAAVIEMTMVGGMRVPAAVMLRIDGTEQVVLSSGGEGRMDNIALDARGKYVAHAGDKGMIRLWSVDRLKEAAAAGNHDIPADMSLNVAGVRKDLPWQVAFHPGNRLFMASGDGYLASWDVDAGNPEKTTVAATVKGQEYLLPDLAFSADGRTAALLWYVRNRAETGTPQGGNQVLLFDVSDPVQPKFRMAMPVSAGKQGRVVISPDGRWLAVGSLGGFPHVWDLSAQDIAASEQRPPVMSGETQALAFSPDSRRLAMGSAAGTLAIWSPLGLGHLEQIENRNPISCLVWLPDGRVATGTENGLLLLWETDPDKLAELARRVAGRELSDAERERFGVLAR
jgi:WD40 repeat protein/tRNA A-37 threonylcarbamoyl transferase component Bud32